MVSSKKSTLPDTPLIKISQSMIADFAEHAGQCFKLADLEQFIAENRKRWEIPASMPVEATKDALVQSGKLKVWKFSFPKRPETRFTWGEASIYRVAASLKSKSYFSHYTALHYHGLTEQTPKTIYLNSEQTPKGAYDTRDTLAQGRIDAAFKRAPRQSATITTMGEFRICVLAGKYTNRLGVIAGETGALRDLPVTDLERTLIDIAVRPFYAGGPFEVLKAYERAKGGVSLNQLAAYLKQMDYVYPYHQVIGFYLECAGHPADRLSIFQEMGLRNDFYLTYQLGEPEYSSRWRIFYPKGFQPPA